MFLDITNIPTELLQNKIAEKYENKTKSDENFISDHNSHIACFIGGTKPFTGLFFVTDNIFKPYMCFKTNAYIDRCAISDKGKYAVIKTCSNPEHDADSDVIIILDLENQREISRPDITTPWNKPYIDENENLICFRYEGVELRYSFDGELINKSSLTGYYELPYISPYALDERVNNLLDAVVSGSCAWVDTEHEVSSLLERLKLSLEMSHYQLSLTYKKLGEVLSKQEDIKGAITAYETGLILNPKLVVKRALGKLKKENPDIAISTPIVQSIEKEKLWETDDYLLPPTLGDVEATPDKRKEFVNEYTDTIYEIANAFIESLETDAAKFCKSIPNLNTMSDADFGVFFNKLCKRFDGNVRKEARRHSETIIEKHTDDNPLSVREEIVLNLHSMIWSYTGINLKNGDVI